MKPKCKIVAISDVEHLQQIYTGFALLDAGGVVDVSQEIPAEFTENKTDGDRWTDYKFYNTTVILNDRIKICYDLHDRNWIDEKILADVDFYFKRSFDPAHIATLNHKDKVFPLGLNYQVTTPQRDIFKLKRTAFYSGKDKLKTIIRSLRLDDYLGGKDAGRMDNLEALPDADAEPRVLFMARAWDTQKIESKVQKEAVDALNEMRAECVRVLRKQFGNRFFGGLAHDDYSQKHFSDCLLPNAGLSQKSKFVETLKNFPICVTTVGLNGSNGWKLAEYVALSKAIVTEPLVYNVPGNFEKEQNYLEFTTPSSLIEATTLLFEDPDLRQSLMTNNYNYYLSNVRADTLVLNSLNVVLEKIGEPVISR